MATGFLVGIPALDFFPTWLYTHFPGHFIHAGFGARSEKKPAHHMFGLIESSGAVLGCSQPDVFSVWTAESIPLDDASLVYCTRNLQRQPVMTSPADDKYLLSAIPHERCK